MDTAQLLHQCQAGDAAAIETLVHTYQSGMYRLALLLLDDPAEADDAVQEAFLSAFRALHTYQGSASLKTWLMAILVNESHDRLRKKSRLTRLKTRLQAFYLLREDPPYPEKTAIQHEADRDVWQAIQALGEKHRLPVILRYYQELSVAEIAQMLAISEGTVHSRLNTARERLRAVLRPLKAEDHE